MTPHMTEGERKTECSLLQFKYLVLCIVCMYIHTHTIMAAIVVDKV